MPLVHTLNRICPTLKRRERKVKLRNSAEEKKEETVLHRQVEERTG